MVTLRCWTVSGELWIYPQARVGSTLVSAVEKLQQAQGVSTCTIALSDEENTALSTMMGHPEFARVG